MYAEDEPRVSPRNTTAGIWRDPMMMPERIGGQDEVHGSANEGSSAIIQHNQASIESVPTAPGRKAVMMSMP